MALVWDYDVKNLKKSKQGRLLLLERQINFGVNRGQKIKLSQVKKNWSKLHLQPRKRRLLKFLIWQK